VGQNWEGGVKKIPPPFFFLLYALMYPI